MQIGVGARTHVAQHLDTVFFWAIISFLGHLNASLRCPGLALRPNIVVSLMWSLRHVGFVIFSLSYIALRKATLVYCDNVSAVYLSGNPVQHQRTKHVEIDIHFVREMVARGQVHVLHVPSRYQYADIFTKGLPRVLFEEFRTSLSICKPPASTEGA